MRNLLTTVLLALLHILAGSSVHADVVSGGLYGLAAQGGGAKETDVFLIDPTNANLTLVAHYAGIQFHSLEIASNGTVYATGSYDGGSGGGVDTNLYTLDLSAGTYSSVGTFGADLYFGGMSFASDGTLYASGTDFVNNSLFTIDTATGNASEVAVFDPVPGQGLAGFGFNGDGSILYGIEMGGGLYTVDEITGDVTLVGGSTSGINALAVNPADGLIYGRESSAVSGAESLVRISAIDGSTAFVGSLAVGDLNSLTFANISAVPEPSGMWVAALLLGVTVRRRRQRDLVA